MNKLKGKVKKCKRIYLVCSVIVFILLAYVFFKLNKGQLATAIYNLIKLKVMDFIEMYKYITTNI